MSEEKIAILRMLEEGKITAEEAERLLRAVGEEAGREDQKEKKDFFGTVGEGIGRAFKTVQDIDVDRIVNEAVDSVQRSPAGRFVSEVVDEVTEAVGDFAASGEREEVVEEEEWTLDGEGVARVRAETGNGGITLSAAEDDQVRVRAVKKVRGRDQEATREFAGQVKITVEQVGDEIRITREYPRPPRGIRVEVGYEIQAPPRLDLSLHALNGKIRVQGAGANVEAVSANGAVELEGGRGQIRAHTKNGKINAAVEVLEGGGEFASLNGRVEVKINEGQAPVEAKTLNGSIELTLPGDFNGQLDAETTNGQVQSEFPITVTGKVKKNHLEGPIGHGGEDAVRLHTLNGSIHLKKPD